MSKEIHVLVIEDSPQDTALINYELRKAGLRFRSRRVESRDAFLHELEHHSPDIILSDHGVPGFDGLAALAEARSRCPSAPFIFVTGAPREEAAKTTLQSGADDYVLKDHLNLLGPAIERALRESNARTNCLRLETALLDAEEQLQLLTKELKEHATFMLDAEGRVATWNPGAEQMLGYKPKEILNHDLAELFAPEPPEQGRPRNLLELATRKGRAQLDASLARNNGGSFPAQVSVIALGGGTQRLRGFLCVLRDHIKSDSAPAESNNRVAQLEAATSEMEKFTHVVAADLQLPLRQIESCAQLLARNAAGQLDQKNQNYLETISEAAHRMSRLVDDLFTFSRIGRTEMYHLPLSLNDVAQEIIHDLKHQTDGRNVEWVVGQLPEVTGDSVMLWQVLTNLISNALKFTRTAARARIEIGASETDPEHVIFVRDNGVGFEQQSAERLFGVFERLHVTEFEGSGVGLANVRRIIERHGGRVWAEGTPGEGATFYFSLPK
jgi:PAS domain S-box-containing protein